MHLLIQLFLVSIYSSLFFVLYLTSSYLYRMCKIQIVVWLLTKQLSFSATSRSSVALKSVQQIIVLLLDRSVSSFREWAFYLRLGWWVIAFNNANYNLMMIVGRGYSKVPSSSYVLLPVHGFRCHSFIGILFLSPIRTEQEVRFIVDSPHSIHSLLV